MFNSPLAWCSARRCYAALDESRADCVSRNHCTASVCPLTRYFVTTPIKEAAFGSNDSFHELDVSSPGN